MALNPDNQDDWGDILYGSMYTVYHVCSMIGIVPSTFVNWTRAENRSTPNKKNHERTRKVMSEVIKNPRIQKHPSFGYATEDQIRKLKELGLCPERDSILAKIEKQNKAKGKLVT